MIWVTSRPVRFTYIYLYTTCSPWQEHEGVLLGDLPISQRMGMMVSNNLQDKQD